MTVLPFPAARIVRYDANEAGQPVSPLALLFIPARLWVASVTWWLDVLSGDSRDLTIHIGRVNEDD